MLFYLHNNLLIYLKDYVDDVESLWQRFCSLHFKDIERDECESYYELYWVKYTKIVSRIEIDSFLL